MHYPLIEWIFQDFKGYSMIQPYHSKFLTPTKEFRRLSVLLSIENYSRVSQQKIGEMTRLSSSMVNNYIKLLKRENLIQVTGDTNRNQCYHLTSEGEGILKESLLAYSTEIMQLYISVKEEIVHILNGFYEEGIRILAFFGAAETAEVVHSAIKETDLVVIGVVDSNMEKQGKPFNGLIIQSPEKLEKMNPDAVLITSFAKQEEISRYISNTFRSKIKIKKITDFKENL